MATKRKRTPSDGGGGGGGGGASDDSTKSTHARPIVSVRSLVSSLVPPHLISASAVSVEPTEVAPTKRVKPTPPPTASVTAPPMKSFTAPPPPPPPPPAPSSLPVVVAVAPPDPVRLVETAAKTIAAAAARSNSKSPPRPPPPVAHVTDAVAAFAPVSAADSKPASTKSKRAPPIKVKAFVPFSKLKPSAGGGGGGGVGGGGGAGGAATTTNATAPTAATAVATDASTSGVKEVVVVPSPSPKSSAAAVAAANEQRERDRQLQAARQSEERARTQQERSAAKEKRRTARARAHAPLIASDPNPIESVVPLSNALTEILARTGEIAAGGGDVASALKPASLTDAKLSPAPAAAATASVLSPASAESAERERDRKEREQREARRKREQLGIEKENYELVLFDTPQQPAAAPASPPPPAPAPPLTTTATAAVVGQPLAPVVRTSPAKITHPYPSDDSETGIVFSGGGALRRPLFPVTPPRAGAAAPIASTRSPLRPLTLTSTPEKKAAGGGGAAAAVATGPTPPAGAGVVSAAPYTASILNSSLPSGYVVSGDGDPTRYQFRYGRPVPSVVELISVGSHPFRPYPRDDGDKPVPASERVRIASFDMDDTLITTRSGKRFASDAYDWIFLNSNVAKRVQHCALARAEGGGGYQICLFSNQLGISTGKSKEFELLTKILTVAEVLSVPMRVCLSIGDDSYRKPGAGMFELMARGYAIDRAGSFFVGDAAGRSAAEKAGAASGGSGSGSQDGGGGGGSATGRIAGFYGTGDWSGSDRRFAVNAGIAFYTPDAFFVPLGREQIPLYRPPSTITSTSASTATAAASASGGGGGGSGGSGAAAGGGDSASHMDSKHSKPTTAASAGTGSGGGAAAAGAAAAGSTPTGGGDNYTRPYQEVVMFVGMPASGKSTFYTKYFSPSRYVHINRDTPGMGTVAQCLVRLRSALLSGSSCVIDNTHPSRASRQPYLDCIRECSQLLTSKSAGQSGGGGGGGGGGRAGGGGGGGAESGSQSPPHSPSSASGPFGDGKSQQTRSGPGGKSPTVISVRCYVFNTGEQLAKKLNIYRNRLSSATALIPHTAYHNFKTAYQHPQLSEGFTSIETVDILTQLKFSDRQHYIFEHSKEK